MTKNSQMNLRLHAIQLVANVALKCQEQMLSYEDYKMYAKRENGANLLDDTAIFQIWDLVMQQRLADQN